MYSPKIKEDLIPVLYGLAKQERRPMTQIVDGILRNELRRKELINEREGTETRDEER